MPDLKIKVYKAGQVKPEMVVTIPLTIVRMATKLMPTKVKSALENEGIDLNEIVSIAEKQDVTGKLVEVEKETERIVISIERTSRVIGE